ncbi:regucalcin [Streptomyces sp. CBMAI 2042]|uniref:hypothetical protein n=1 Tax=Streptomyces sp. CBMAI 2042 TaxID=2305222 RepID=UPI000F1B5037|nr:hypothetical protein [Streptomyces sp. CBMAI 2042]RLV64345.1 regucalcin [Streptomyces sp. CBMAI 2042]
MSRQQVLIIIVLLLVLTWSVVMAALGFIAAMAALVPSLVLIVQQVVQAGRQPARRDRVTPAAPPTELPAAISPAASGDKGRAG